jgi:hypothetical protein
MVQWRGGKPLNHKPEKEISSEEKREISYPINPRTPGEEKR